MERNIFLIGPASVGKSTVSELLAREIGYTFIDIDLVFCSEVAMIPNYISEHGYMAYCERNSALVDQLVRGIQIKQYSQHQQDFWYMKIPQC
jgi:shikimate kinase